MKILVYGNNKFNDYTTFMRGMVVAIENQLSDDGNKIQVFAGGPNKINQYTAEFVNRTEIYFKQKGYKIKFQRVNPSTLPQEIDKNDINYVLYFSTKDDHREMLDPVISKANTKNIDVGIYKIWGIVKAITEDLSLSKRDNAYLSVAKYMATLSKSRRKHGAVIVRGGSVISTGYNKDKNHPTNVSEEHIKKYCSIHAEVDALKKASNARGATIYVARVNSMGDDMMSRPCSLCYEKIKKAGIKKIVYTI